MSTRPKFRIPTTNEVNKDPQNECKQYSLFKSYQQNKGKSESNSDSSLSTSASKNSSSSTSTLAASDISKGKNATGSKESFSSSNSTSISTAIGVNSFKSSSSSSTNSSSSEQTNHPVTVSTENISSSTAGSGSTSTSSKAASSNSIIVNYRQRGNPILKHIRNVPWQYGSIVPDYVMGVANCALFLSLRYHQLHPEYLHNRLKELGKGYDLRVLLVQVDVKDPHHQLKDLAKICILADLTLILAFSSEEAGRYLEAYKVYENKPAEVLMEKTETDYVSKLTECLTTVKSVNKTDSMTLLSAFKSMDGIINASKEDISFCAGFGPQKAQRLFDVFHEPFVKGRKRLKETSADSSPTKKPS